MSDSPNAPHTPAPLNLAGFVEPSPGATALEWAVAYIACGMAVIPVDARKTPLTPHGVKDATTDERVICHWWKVWPHADPAWAVPTEIVVVDLDLSDGGPDEFSRQEDYGPDDTMTPSARTASGGRHLVFAAGDRRFANKVRVAPGIDLRSAGGYVVLPGARNGREWLNPLSAPLSLAPDWLMTAKDDSEGRPAGATRPFMGEATAYAAGGLADACSKIAAAPIGEQNAILNKESFSIGGLVGGGELDEGETIEALTDAGMRMANAPRRRPWTERIVRRVVTEAIAKGAEKPRNTPDVDPEGEALPARLLASAEVKRKAAGGLASARPMSTIRLSTSTEVPFRDANGDVIAFAAYPDPVCNVIPFPCPDASRLAEKQLALVNAGRVPHRASVAGTVYDTALSFAESAIDDLLSYVAERKGRPVEITDDARAEFIDEIGLEIALAVELPIRGVVELSRAFLASLGFARFKAAVHEFYENGVVIAAEADCDDENAKAGDTFESIRVPGAVGEFMDWVVACSPEPSRALALAAGLAWFGALAGRQYASPSNARTNLYTLGLAGSGFGKEIARTCIKSLAIKSGLDRFLGAGDIMSGSGVRKRVEQQASLIYLIDEYAQLNRKINDPRQGGSAGQVKKYLLEYFSTAHSVFLGADYAAERGQPIHNPNLCFYGTTTPDDFWDSCSTMSAKDGYLPRLLAFTHQTKEFVAPTFDGLAAATEPPQSLVDVCRAIMKPKAAGSIDRASADSGQRPYPAQVVPWGTGAKEAYENFYIEYARKAHNASPFRRAFLRRVNEHAIKIALVVAVGVDPESPAITLEILRLGQKIATICVEYMMREAAGNLADNEAQRQFKMVKAMIDKASGQRILKSAITKGVNGAFDKRRLDSILDELVGSADYTVSVAPGKGGGRPGMTYSKIPRRRASSH